MPDDVPAVTGYAYWGCWTEGEGVRALDRGKGGGGSVSDGGGMSVEACSSYCINGGFAMFGLEYSSECWCGDALDESSVVAIEEDCSMVCSGDPAQKCGGPNRLSVYLWS